MYSNLQMYFVKVCNGQKSVLQHLNVALRPFQYAEEHETQREQLVYALDIIVSAPKICGCPTLTIWYFSLLLWLHRWRQCFLSTSMSVCAGVVWYQRQFPLSLSPQCLKITKKCLIFNLQFWHFSPNMTCLLSGNTV